MSKERVHIVYLAAIQANRPCNGSTMHWIEGWVEPEERRSRSSPRECSFWLDGREWKCEMRVRLKADGSERKQGLIVSVGRYTSLSPSAGLTLMLLCVCLSKRIYDRHLVGCRLFDWIWVATSVRVNVFINIDQGRGSGAGQCSLGCSSGWKWFIGTEETEWAEERHIALWLVGGLSRWFAMSVSDRVHIAINGWMSGSFYLIDLKTRCAFNLK